MEPSLWKIPNNPDQYIPEAGGDPVTRYDVYAGGVTIRTPKWQGWAVAAKEKLDGMMGEKAA